MDEKEEIIEKTYVDSIVRENKGVGRQVLAG